jgi:hypothetical protein
VPAARRDLAYGAALAAAALLAVALHAGALGHGFVGDDHYLVEHNPALQAPGALGRALRPGAWGAAADAWNREVNARFYRPTTIAWFIADVRLFGAGPRGLHLMSLLAHAGCAVLAGLVLTRLCRSRTVGAAGALLFAAHAVHTEAVSMITYRSTLAEGLFVLAALACEGAARDAAARRARWRWRAGGIAAAVLALGAKETAVTLPALVALLYLAPGGTPDAGGAARWRGALRAALPYGALAAATLALRAAVAPAAGWTFFAGHGAGTVALSMLGVLGLYARLLVFPLRFTPFYDWSLVVVQAPLAPEAVAGFALALVLALGPLVLWRRHPRAALLLAWLTLTLLPVMNLVPFTVAAGERLLYVPAVGWVGLCGLGLAALLRHGRGRAVLAAVLLVAALGLHGAQAVRRTADWRDDETLLTAMVRDYPESVAGHIHLARHLARSAPVRPAAACAQYRAALDLAPDLARVRDEARAHGCEGGPASAPAGASARPR